MFFILKIWGMNEIRLFIAKVQEKLITEFNWSLSFFKVWNNLILWKLLVRIAGTADTEYIDKH